MATGEMRRQYGPFSKSSRRSFLKGAALAMTGPGLARAGRSQTRVTNRSILAYAGTYSSPQGPEGSAGHGEGIYLFEMNPSTGVLSPRRTFPDSSNPSWLALDPSRTHLYAGNEITNFGGTHSGSVSAFSVDRSNGNLTLLNTVSSEGAGPAHLSVHPSGKFVLVANYAGGAIAVLPIRSGGELGSATEVKQDKGRVGPPRAASRPPGSFAISGHHFPHAHMIQSDPSGHFVLSSDLGMDRIFMWKLDLQKGQLSPNSPASISLPPGDGPRHFTFHPNGRWMYSLQEEGSTLVLFDYDAAQGRLTARQTVSSLPPGFAGTNFASEVRVSPDGKFVYAANRLHDSIGVFAVGEAGQLAFLDEEWTRGDYPRSFTIDPTGNFLYSCNQRSDVIAAFRIHRKTGHLHFTGQYTPVGTPAILVFLD